MIIFLRRINASTNKSQIIGFIEPNLNGGFFHKSGKIQNVKIMILKDAQNNNLEYHGLVTINSDAVAKRIIKKLNRKVLNGKAIMVREFQFRSWQNDPRINMHELNEEIFDKRKGSRRRIGLINISEEGEVSSRNFSTPWVDINTKL